MLTENLLESQGCGATAGQLTVYESLLCEQNRASPSESPGGTVCGWELLRVLQVLEALPTNKARRVLTSLL